MTKERVKFDAVDLICLVTSLALIIMALQSYLITDRLKYQLYTGLFSALICLLPMLLKHKRIMSIPSPLVLLIELAIFLHGYGVLLMQYDNMAWYDSVTHTTSSIVVGLCAFYILLEVNRPDGALDLGPMGMSMFLVLIMMTFSVYWEVFELFVDLLAGTNMQYSPFDTTRDMLSNAFGGFIASAYARYFMKNHPHYDVAEEFRMHPYLRRLLSSKS
jgi:hypothetical protein